MKKTLLFVMSMLAMAFNASAQTLDFFDNMEITKMSNDGKILCATDHEGNLAVFNYDTEEFDFVMSGYDAERDFMSPLIHIGFGRAFDNANRFVANYDECTPAIYDHGEWIMLPIDEAAHVPGKFNAADDITPDGKRICGGIAPASFGLGDHIMLVPVIWDQNADGTYGMYKVLPHPEKDFTGRVPQYITARAMSEDGKTIIGQIVDYSGFWPMPIVYREDANGEWSYEILCEDLVYNKEVVWPEWPTEPTQVNPLDYMTAEEKAAYEQALVDYEAAVDAYWNGERDDYPMPVEAADYIADPTAFNAAMDVYRQEQAAYETAMNNFFDMLYDPANVYGPAFQFNDAFISPDGKYYAGTLIAEGEPDPMAWFPSMNSSPIRINLEDNSYVVSEMTDDMPTSVLADGSIICAGGCNDMTRDAKVWSLDGEVTPLLSCVEKASAAAANLVKENMTYTLGDFDENWEQIPGEEVTWMGTPIASKDGSIIAGFQYNSFYEAGDWYLFGYKLDMKLADSIEKNVASATSKASAYVVTSVSGAELYRGNNVADARKAMAKGVNLFTTVMSDGSQNTVKVNKK